MSDEKTNEKSYAGKDGAKYLASQILTHAGITIAFALGKAADDSLFIDYSILNAETETTDSEKAKQHDDGEKLDSDHWFADAKTVRFPSEVRVVGEEAVPVWEFPLVDTTGQAVSADNADKADPWNCTSMCLMDTSVNYFQVLSDGKYIYIFRQSRQASDPFLKKFVSSTNPLSPPVDGNLLCDRFMLVGSSLNKTLEVRFRRSRQKRIPLNNKDTLAVRDINDNPLYEPTFSLRLINGLHQGRFHVLQTPTMTNDVSRWVIFTSPAAGSRIECYTADVADDGLFDIHGRIYYTCENEHKPTFMTAPGNCTALKTDGDVCGKARKVVVPKSASSNCALSFDKDTESASKISSLVVSKIDLSAAPFSKSYTLEAWIKPLVADKPLQQQLFRLGPSDDQQAKTCPLLTITENLTVALRTVSDATTLAVSDKLKANAWNHFALKVKQAGTSVATVELLVNGESTKPKDLPIGWNPGSIEALVAQPTTGTTQFTGALDEIRLWSIPLESSTVKARMATRLTGMEPYLEALWHLDESSDLIAFDATSNGHNMSINLTVAPTTTSPITFLWNERPAPMLDTVGLTKRYVRLRDDIVVAGGLGASVYFEQVSISTSQTVKDERTASDAKSLKRGARVLLCFVSKPKSKTNNTLAVIDFGLLKDGTLSDTPPLVSVRAVKVVEQDSGTNKVKTASTGLINVDSLGVETFCGFLDFAAAQCQRDSPLVWNSATGTVTVYYKNLSGTFSALTYDVSRTMSVATPITLTTFPGIMAASKLRQVKSLKVRTMSSDFEPTVAIDLEIVATMMADGQPVKMIELWQNVPASIESMCGLLTGNTIAVRTTIGVLASAITSYDYKHVLTISLAKELVDPVEAATCLDIGGWRYIVKKAAPAKSTSLQLYGYAMPAATMPTSMTKDTPVIAVGYDHSAFVKTKGKPVPDYTLGSALVAIAPAPPDPSTPSKTKPKPIASGCSATINSNADSPFFGDSRPSAALQMKNNITFTMLNPAIRTSAAPGLAFEGWVKVDKAVESVIIAYTSEKAPISTGTANTNQTFVLATLTKGNDAVVKLVCNINGQLKSIEDDTTLRVHQWFHIACSIRNSVAILFDRTTYVDLGDAMDFNVGDFSLAFTLYLTQKNRSQIVLTKAWNTADDHCPIQVEVTSDNHLKLSYWASDENGSKDNIKGHAVTSTGNTFEIGTPYKVFVSRAYTEVKREGKAPRWAQVVTMRAWDANDKQLFSFGCPDKHTIEEADLKLGAWAEPCGPVASDSAHLCLGGAAWASDGLTGIVGSVRLYSSAISTPTSFRQFCTTSTSEKALLGSWTECDKNSFIDDTSRNHGKFKKDPKVITSPFPPDHHLAIYLNGKQPAKVDAAADAELLRKPAGLHQLTLGNVMHESNPDGAQPGRFLLLGDSFEGEFDEFRIWNTPRTRNNVCDTMNSTLAECPPEMAVYLPFDLADKAAPANATGALGILMDRSDNRWHLTPLFGDSTEHAISKAPVGKDAACVQHTYGSMEAEHTTDGVALSAYPSVTEYGTMQLGATGSYEGSFKRAYSFVDKDGLWRIDTGFRIGTLLTEWVSQVQTSPTLIGYVEGAPPVPAENFPHKDDRPMSSIKFVNTNFVQYSYGLRSEHATETNINFSLGAGAEWKINAGIGVETEVSAGKFKGYGKFLTDITDGQFNNNVSTSKSHSNLDVKMDLTGTWLDDNALKHQSSTAKRKLVLGYNPANTGLALVESEVADVFALRLKIRNGVAPLVAYQMRPNPDIPKDRNLVTFPINNKYTKQGCLNGRRDLAPDVDYYSTEDAPKDASYYKPIEAYALKDRIRRAEEQLAGEYERYTTRGAKDANTLPKRTCRNICNSYVWTAEGGSYQETHQTMDFVQQEVGGNHNTKIGGGAGYDLEMSIAGGLITSQFDCIGSAHTNVMQTKDKQSEVGFELLADLPPPTNIRDQEWSDELDKRPGAVDAYRWMTFWLEPSVEGTDAFFKQVVDDQWLSESRDPSAALLRSLRDRLNNEVGSVRTRAWRLFHRVTYVSRVGQPIKASNAATVEAEKKTGALLADISCNWLILQRIEPLVRGFKTRDDMKDVAVATIKKWYPAVAADPRLMSQLLELIGDYIGLDV